MLDRRRGQLFDSRHTLASKQTIVSTLFYGQSNRLSYCRFMPSVYLQRRPEWCDCTPPPRVAAAGPFQQYNSGIFAGCTSTQPDHAITARHQSYHHWFRRPSHPGCGLRHREWRGLLADQELLGDGLGRERLHPDEEGCGHVRHRRYHCHRGLREGCWSHRRYYHHRGQESLSNPNQCLC